MGLNIEIRKLTSDLAEDYVRFFDTTPHDQFVDAHKCYCVCWSNDDCEGKDFSTAEKRRNLAFQYVKNSNIQGYLAYHDNKVVGWCNANTKTDCLKCVGWRRNMGYVPVDDSDKKVKSIFCFTIAPEMKRKEIATLLLERVCHDAVKDGFDLLRHIRISNRVTCHPILAGMLKCTKNAGFTSVWKPSRGL